MLLTSRRHTKRISTASTRGPISYFAFTFQPMTDSRTFAAVMAGLFVVVGFLVPSALAGLALRLIGTVSCLYSIFDIYWDVLAERGDQTVQNDAVVFSALSGVSPQSVGMAWLVGAVIFFLFTLRSSLRMDPEELQQMRSGDS